eukprot:g45967.t1
MLKKFSRPDSIQGAVEEAKDGRIIRRVGGENKMDGNRKVRDGNGEVQEGDGGVRNSPGEFEGGMESIGEVDELFKLLAGARGHTNVVISLAEKEVGSSWTKGERMDLRYKEMCLVEQEQAETMGRPGKAGLWILVLFGIFTCTSWMPILDLPSVHSDCAVVTVTDTVMDKCISSWQLGKDED